MVNMCWTARTTLEKTLLAVCVTLCISLAAGGLVAMRSSHARQLDSRVCQTLECVAESASMARHMDTSTAPCHDFYQFACGGWLASNRLEAGQKIVTLDDRNWDRHDELVQVLSDERSSSKSEPEYVNKFRTFYRSCTHTSELFSCSS